VRGRQSTELRLVRVAAGCPDVWRTRFAVHARRGDRREPGRPRPDGANEIVIDYRSSNRSIDDQRPIARTSRSSTGVPAAVGDRRRESRSGDRPAPATIAILKQTVVDDTHLRAFISATDVLADPLAKDEYYVLSPKSKLRGDSRLPGVTRHLPIRRLG